MMSSPVRVICAVVLLAALAHAQGFPGRRTQREAKPRGQFSSSSASSSSSSSSSGGPVFFGGGGGYPGNGYYPSGGGGGGYHPAGGFGFVDQFGDYDNGGHLGVRLGAIPGGQAVQVSSSSHNSGRRPGGSTGSFVSSSSSTDGDGKIHYNVESGRY